MRTRNTLWESGTFILRADAVCQARRSYKASDGRPDGVETVRCSANPPARRLGEGAHPERGSQKPV